MDEFDACAKTSNADIKTAGAKGGLVPSFAHGMAVSSAVSGAIYDSATNFFNSDQSAQEGADQLFAAVAAAM